MGATRGKRAALFSAGVLAVSVAGCSAVGDYARSRLLDLWDIVPISVRAGPGGKVTVSATRFLGAGLGYGSASAAGMAPGRWGPTWEEFWYQFALLGSERWELSRNGTQRWPGGPRLPSRFYKYGDWSENGVRYLGNTLLLIPAGIGPDGWVPKGPGGQISIEEPWHSWANVEVDVLAGVGLRVGVCPDEVVDFLAGLLGLDLIGDDVGGSTDRDWEDGPVTPKGTSR
jgi:hypothetical protein